MTLWATNEGNVVRSRATLDSPTCKTNASESQLGALIRSKRWGGDIDKGACSGQGVQAEGCRLNAVLDLEFDREPMLQIWHRQN